MAGGIASILSASLLIGCLVRGFLLAVGRAVGCELVIVEGVVVLGLAVEKMMTINEQVADLNVKRSNAKKSSGNGWEGCNEMLVEMGSMVSTLPRPNLSGGFSPIGRKNLRFMAGAAAVGTGIGLRT
jgi:hypothetical protein